MSTWNPQARPVPADGVRVALAAASEGTDLVVLDPLSETEFAVRRPALWAIAQAQRWRPSFESAAVLEAFEASVRTELSVLSVDLVAGDPAARLAGPELIVRLELIDGLTRADCSTPRWPGSPSAGRPARSSQPRWTRSWCDSWARRRR